MLDFIIGNPVKITGTNSVIDETPGVIVGMADSSVTVQLSEELPGTDQGLIVIDKEFLIIQEDQIQKDESDEE